MAEMEDAPALEEQPALDRAAFARRWCAEIAAAEKRESKWRERARKIEKIYADERDLDTGRARKFNILWSNVQTQMPAVYMQTPKAKAVRRYRDRDPVARLASTVLERSLQTSCELYDFDNAMVQSVRDFLVVGRGQAWVFYVPTYAGEGDAAQLLYENVEADYVPWPDFLHGPGRTWTEVQWVARRFRKSKRELRKFMEERRLEGDPERISMDYKADASGSGDDDKRAMAQIWEIWDKATGEVIFLAPGSKDEALLGKMPPPVRFMGFFPCPRPLLATTTAQGLVPTPDYALYQDQAEELNTVSARILTLQKALKVVGVYASESTELQAMLESQDNRMIAVKNWAMFAEGGGVKGRIEWFPVEQVANVLIGLYQARDQAKQTLYEISGIGDILRGDTDPNETATAQGIKAKWGSLRVRRSQKDVQRFAAEIFRLKAEIMAEVMPVATLMQMAGMDQEQLAKYAPPQAFPMVLQQVEALLKNDMARNFRIDVETDSTLEPDQQEEKAAAVEFVTAMTGFMEKAAPLAAQGPEAAKLVGEMLLFAVRRFDKVDQLEQTIEQAVEAASQPRPPQPDPEMVKAEAERKRDNAKLVMMARKTDAEIATMTRKADAEIQIEGVKAQAKVAQGEQQMGIAARREEMERAVREGSPP